VRRARAIYWALATKRITVATKSDAAQRIGSKSEYQYLRHNLSLRDFFYALFGLSVQLSSRRARFRGAKIPFSAAGSWTPS
jgi:hypothetical protein